MKGIFSLLHQTPTLPGSVTGERVCKCQGDICLARRAVLGCRVLQSCGKGRGWKWDHGSRCGEDKSGFHDSCWKRCLALCFRGCCSATKTIKSLVVTSFPKFIQTVFLEHLVDTFTLIFSGSTETSRSLVQLTSPFTPSVNGFKMCFKGREGPRADVGNIVLH